MPALDEALRTDRLLASAQRVAQIGSWEYDIPADRLWWCETTCRIFGVPFEAAGRGLADFTALVEPEDRGPLAQARAQAAQRGGLLEAQYRIRRPDGTQCLVQERGEEFRDAAGRPVRRLGVVLDVTRQHQAEQAAAQARVAQAAAEAANRAKSEFLSHMSHELRTPLNAVLGFVQLLQDEDVAALARRRERLDGIRRSGERLLALIDDLLDVAQVESGALVLALRPLDALALAQAVLGVLRPAADAAEVTLALDADIPDGVPWLQADEGRLRQVLLRLLGNALRAAARGDRIALRLRATAAQVGFDMPAAGPGPHPGPPSLQDPVPTGDGAGLGLALVQQLLQRMGGQLDIDARPGGHGVRVLLPRTAAPQAVAAPSAPSLPSALEPGPQAAPAAAVPPAPDEPCGVVLYVEDNAVNALLMQELLARWPRVRVLLAHDGAEGLRLARSERPDLLLLDMQLPDMHGTELLRQLQADAHLRTLPVVAVSANAMAEDVAQARALGVRDYWIKPLDFAQVTAVLRRLLPGAGDTLSGAL